MHGIACIWRPGRPRTRVAATAEAAPAAGPTRPPTRPRGRSPSPANQPAGDRSNDLGAKCTAFVHPAPRLVDPGAARWLRRVRGAPDARAALVLVDERG